MGNANLQLNRPEVYTTVKVKLDDLPRVYNTELYNLYCGEGNAANFFSDRISVLRAKLASRQRCSFTTRAVMH
jgi:hypothetical protein